MKANKIRNRIRPVRAVLAASVFGVSLVGCGSIVKQSASESKIASQVERTFNINVRQAHCPSDVEVRADDTYRCQIVTDGGQKLSATIQIMNDDADLQIKALSG